MGVKQRLRLVAWGVGALGAAGWLLMAWSWLEKGEGFWMPGVAFGMAVLMLAAAAGVDKISRGRDL